MFKFRIIVMKTIFEFNKFDQNIKRPNTKRRNILEDQKSETAYLV